MYITVYMGDSEVAYASFNLLNENYFMGAIISPWTFPSYFFENKMQKILGETQIVINVWMTEF